MRELLNGQLRKIDKLLFSPFSNHFIRVLERECVNSCTTLLDIGCGAYSPVRHFSEKLNYTVGIDSFEPAIRRSKEFGIHSEYRIMDCRNI